MARTRVLLAEDHTVVAQGLESLLQDTFDLVGTVGDGQALLEAVDALKPDVILTDLSMPLLGGMDAIRQIRKRRPEAKVVVLTMHRDKHLAAEALRAGASGYLIKSSPIEEIISGIQHAAQGRTYVTTLLSKDLIDHLLDSGGQSSEPSLTPRQRQMLQLIGEGKTMKEAAAILSISPRTAETHKYEIMRALGVQTTAELVQWAMRLKLTGE